MKTDRTLLSSIVSIFFEFDSRIWQHLETSLESEADCCVQRGSQRADVPARAASGQEEHRYSLLAGPQSGAHARIEGRKLQPGS